MAEYKLDVSPLLNAISKSPMLAGQGAKLAMDMIKDDWVGEARDIAPLDSSNLRKQISGTDEGAGLNLQVIVTANATQKNKRGKAFNYAYYIHEGHMAEAGKKLQTAGTVEAFLEESVDETRWQKWLEDEVEDALKKAGW